MSEVARRAALRQQRRFYCSLSQVINLFSNQIISQSVDRKRKTCVEILDRGIVVSAVQRSAGLTVAGDNNY